MEIRPPEKKDTERAERWVVEIRKGLERALPKNKGGEGNDNGEKGAVYNNTSKKGDGGGGGQSFSDYPNLKGEIQKGENYQKVKCK